MELTFEEKTILLSLARESIQSLFSSGKPKMPDIEKHPVLRENAGAFVTLTINGRLRGCIGYVESDKPLYETVVDAAKQAALNDPRFTPLTENEYEQIDLEISVLSPPFKMNSYDEIEIGTHGLILEEGFHRGLLLPQVPVEHNMNKEQYLSALCEKAGLYSGYWKEKTLSIRMFTANVFSEKDLKE